MTSHDVVRRIRRLCHTRKVGHAGTLDPLATGVLPVAVGQGTKLLQFLLAENKSYRATFKLGETTDTLDCEGAVAVVRPVPKISFSELDSVCEAFRGRIEQLPPMYSALKHNGVPLYKLARKGETVERQPRQIRIDRLDILDVDGESFTLEVDCSKGTYIRTLGHDIGEALGCGAHLTALCRLRSGDFLLEDCFSLDQLEKSDDISGSLIPLIKALPCFPLVNLSEPAAEALKFGIPPDLSHVTVASSLQPGDLVRLTYTEQLVAVARFAPERTHEVRGDFELVRVLVSH